ncbi:hypothetical protein RAB80_009932 [Fusarium oxysporum f. sp. vasinfectum]|uniref:Uncharacterized protein n=1 Tax=Fusarium oxysporum f. sp. vasinfectum 25433 TaxID=1089449 RepID=X0KX22_FUSOX|nr:hypothetical protein FOTG_13721 [Fusarium oxysporum f. sp. vasinfectum 25433]KAK2674948.1 hypothetical protein RAB80_009932 [Fusarium oxysporum f. sp. vasinfectum]
MHVRFFFFLPALETSTISPYGNKFTGCATPIEYSTTSVTALNESENDKADMAGAGPVNNATTAARPEKGMSDNRRSQKACRDPWAAIDPSLRRKQQKPSNLNKKTPESTPPKDGQAARSFLSGVVALCPSQKTKISTYRHRRKKAPVQATGDEVTGRGSTLRGVAAEIGNEYVSR